MALCYLSAETWTWVSTFLSHAGLVAGALGVGNALGFAVWWGSSVLGQTRTGWVVIDYLALGVGSAG